MSERSDRNDRPDTKFVIFLDSFGHGDLEHTDWIRGHCHDGTLDAGTPYVTPKVLGEIYTGTNPAEHGLPAVSRYDTDPRGRPTNATLPELAAESGAFDAVLQYRLPFIVPPDCQATDCEYVAFSQAMGQQAAIPSTQEAQLVQPGPAGNISRPEEHADVAFDARVDYTQQLFGAARNLAQGRGFDVVFISYRLLDSYCHYDFDKPEDDGRTYRDRLLVEVDRQARMCYNLGDVFVFGDHGARGLEDVFRINRWLLDRGYLDVDLDFDFIESARAYGVLDETDGPGETLLTNTPGVDVNEAASVAISDDPFSSGLTLLEGATPDSVADLVNDLRATDAIETVSQTGPTSTMVDLTTVENNTATIGDVELDTLGWEGPYIEECPDLYPRRAPGVFVSGNLHPEKGGDELTRSGVHHPIGNWGGTAYTEPLGAERSEPINPRELFHVIGQAYLGLEPDDLERDAGAGAGITQADIDQQLAQEHLEDLGYL